MLRFAVVVAEIAGVVIAPLALVLVPVLESDSDYAATAAAASAAISRASLGCAAVVAAAAGPESVSAKIVSFGPPSLDMIRLDCSRHMRCKRGHEMKVAIRYRTRTKYSLADLLLDPALELAPAPEIVDLARRLSSA